MYNLSLDVGRLFDEGEVQGRRRVAVLGSAVPHVVLLAVRGWRTLGTPRRYENVAASKSTAQQVAAELREAILELRQGRAN